MESVKKILVEVVYANTLRQALLTTYVKEGSTLEETITSSGIMDLFPEIDLSKQKIGIFSQQKKLSDIVREGDRIEIYRPLLLDPKEARRKRANQQKK